MLDDSSEFKKYEDSTISNPPVTITFGGTSTSANNNELQAPYRSIIDDQRIHWTVYQGFHKLLGKGGQGRVYLSHRKGADGFTLPVAVKVFSPDPFPTVRDYEKAMSRVARVSARVALIQQDNLLHVHDFVDRNRIRIMVMEWIDGLDVAHLLSNESLLRVRDRVDSDRWEYLTNVVAAPGPSQPQIKPGIAMAIVRDCLAALAALHRQGIVHSDVKPSNLMIKRTGNAKLIDIGSAFEMSAPPVHRTCTPPLRGSRGFGGGKLYSAKRPCKPRLHVNRDAIGPTSLSA